MLVGQARPLCHDEAPVHGTWAKDRRPHGLLDPHPITNLANAEGHRTDGNAGARMKRSDDNAEAGVTIAIAMSVVLRQRLSIRAPALPSVRYPLIVNV
jgi:hypothetical protein